MQSMLQQSILQYEKTIDRFYILFTFTFPEDNEDYTKLFQQHTNHGTIFSEAYITTPTNKNYVLTEQDFQQNAAIFNKVLRYAREQLIDIVAKSVVFNILQKIPNQKEYLTTKKAQLQLAIYNTKKTIEIETFLADDRTWNTFYNWYRIQLIQIVLEQIIIQYGNETLSKLEKEDLNTLFMKVLKEKFEQDSIFLERTIDIVDRQVREWNDRMVEKLESNVKFYLQLKNVVQSIQPEIQYPIRPVHATYIFVLNNVIYQAIREAIYHKQFSGKGWPVSHFKKGKTEGTIQCMPIQHVPTTATIQTAWYHVNNLTTIDVDVLDILCSLFIFKAKSDNEIIEIDLDDILAMRGLKPKLAGNGRRGGYEAKQREQIIASLQRLQSLWILIDKTVLYDKNTKKETSLQGRAILFKTLQGDDYAVNEDNCEKTITYTFEEEFARHMLYNRRQIALLPIQALQYHAYRFSLEKQLCRYLSWRWRTQASKADFLQANKVNTLLGATDIKINVKSPQRTRDRLERALDQLADDFVIAGWHYVELNEDIMLTKGWVKYWLNTSIVIEPPSTVQQHYRSIDKRKKAEVVTSEKTLKERIGLQLAITRKKQRFTLLQMGEILGVTAAYISMIEREQAVPSKKLIAKIEKWLKEQII